MTSNMQCDLGPQATVIVEVLSHFTDTVDRKKDIEDVLFDIIERRGLEAISAEEFVSDVVNVLQRPAFLTIASSGVATVAIINFSARKGNQTENNLMTCAKVPVMTAFLYCICCWVQGAVDRSSSTVWQWFSGHRGSQKNLEADRLQCCLCPRPQ